MPAVRIGIKIKRKIKIKIKRNFRMLPLNWLPDLLSRLASRLYGLLVICAHSRSKEAA